MCVYRIFQIMDCNTVEYHRQHTGQLGAVCVYHVFEIMGCNTVGHYRQPTDNNINTNYNKINTPTPVLHKGPTQRTVKPALKTCI